jgi:predicted  nucleic acid-binding Zn-ribbon protein
MSEQNGHAQKLEDELDEMQERSEQLQDDIDDTREDWERKKHDSDVPGAPPNGDGDGD